MVEPIPGELEIIQPSAGQLAREDRKYGTRSRTRISKPTMSPKDVKSRFSPGAVRKARVPQVIVYDDTTLQTALELAAKAQAKSIGIGVVVGRESDQPGERGTTYHIEGPRTVQLTSEIATNELKEGRAVIVEWYRGPALYMSSELQLVKKGEPPPPGRERIEVKDEETLEQALALATEGPVRLNTKHKSYIIKEDAFNQVGQICTDQLIAGRACIVERYIPAPKGEKPEYSHFELKNVPGAENIVFVSQGNEEQFNKALDLLNRGPVDIRATGYSFKKLSDFDEVAETLVDMLNNGLHPIVEIHKGE